MVDLSSAEWASHVSLTLEKAAQAASEHAANLRALAAEFERDGKDMERGPHAPPLRDLASVLSVAARTLMVQSTDWRRAADARRK